MHMESEWTLHDFLNEWEFSEAKKIEDINGDLLEKGVHFESVEIKTGSKRETYQDQWNYVIAQPPKSELSVQFNFKIEGHEVNQYEAAEIVRRTVKETLKSLEEELNEEDRQTQAEYAGSIGNDS